MSRHPMGSADAAWLHMDRPTNLMVVNGVLWFDEPVDWVRLREVLRQRLVDPYPRFRQRVAEPALGVGPPQWEDDDRFDLDLHLHHVALPAPGGRAELEAFVADRMVAPLDRSRPLWEFHFIDGYGDGAAVLARMHHAIADGIALARVLLSLTDEAREDGAVPIVDEPSDRTGGPLGAVLRPAASALKATRSVVGAAVHESLEVMAHPRHTIDLAAAARDGSQALAKVLLTGPDADTVLRGELGVAERVAWSPPIPLDDVKALGHATGSTVNDVLVAALAGALRDYLVSRDSLVDEIRAIVPFNLRPLDEPLPRDLGNRFGLVTLPLPVGLDDPLERLAVVHAGMDAIKHSPEGPIAYAVLSAIGNDAGPGRVGAARRLQPGGLDRGHERPGPARDHLPRRNSGPRGARVGARGGRHGDERLDPQLRRRRDDRRHVRRRLRPGSRDDRRGLRGPRRDPARDGGFRLSGRRRRRPR